MMNPKYRGNAKDLFKRGFLSLVRSFPLIRGPKVLPFFTGEFQTPDVAAYKQLLAITDSAIVSQARFFPRQGRQEYTEAACVTEHLKDDLFLDPDKGLMASLRGDIYDQDVVTFDEAAALVPAQTDRILMIYDDSVNCDDYVNCKDKAIGEKLDALQAEPLKLYTFAYFNSAPNQPNVVFIANESGRSRLDAIRAEMVRVGIPNTRLLPRL